MQIMQISVLKLRQGNTYLIICFLSLEPSDPTAYIINQISMTKAKEYVKQLNEEQKEVHYTMTHVVGYAVAWGQYKMRKVIGRIKWGTYKNSRDIGTTVLVDAGGGNDLVPVTVWNGHKMTLKEFALELIGKVGKAKKGEDKQHNQSTQMFDFIPSFIAEPLLFGVSYLGAQVGLSIPGLLNPKTFGHVIVTNIGTLGYD